MFKVSPRRISAALCLIVVSCLPLASLAQQVDPQNPQQIDTSPMLDLTREPTAAPATTSPTTTPQQTSRPPNTRPSVAPTTRPSAVPTTKPSVAATPQPSAVATTRPSAVPTTRPSVASTGINPSTPASTEPGENVESAESADNPSAGGGADIPPDPNVLDNAIHTPIYTKPIDQAPAPLDAPSAPVENQRSPYSILSMVLWACFLIAAAATGYFLYVRFSDKD